MIPARIWFNGLLLIVLLVGVSFLLGDVLDRHWIDVHVRGHGLGGELLFVVAGGLLISAGLSRQIIAFLGGYGFGFLQGSALALLSALAACIAVFYSARFLASAYVTRHYSKRVRKLDYFVRENPFSMTLLIRLLPAGSNWMVNVAAGVSSVRTLPFFAGSAIGYIPQMLVFALVGSGTRVEQFWHIALAIALFAVSASLGIYLYSKYRHGKSLDEGLDHELGVNGKSGAPGAD